MSKQMQQIETKDVEDSKISPPIQAITSTNTVSRPSKMSMKSRYEMAVFGKVSLKHSGNKQDASIMEALTPDFEDDFNLFLKEAEREDLTRYMNLRHTIKRKFIRKKPFKNKEFEKIAKELYKSCLIPIKDQHELHINRLIALSILQDIARFSRPRQLTVSHVVYLTWSVMSCMHHFHLRIRIGKMLTGIISYTRKKNLTSCISSYQKIIDKCVPDMLRVALNAILMFFKEGGLIDTDFPIVELLVHLLKRYKNPIFGIKEMLFTTELSTLIDVHEAKCSADILANVFKAMQWKKVHFPQDIMDKLLYMLQSSIIPQQSDNFNYPPLRSTVTICLKNIVSSLRENDLQVLIHLILRKIKHLDGEDNVIIALGDIAEFAAEKYKQITMGKDLSEGPFQFVLTLFEINQPITNLLAARIWQNLIDRRQNKTEFYTPKIYFFDTYYDIKITKVNENERILFKRLRTVMYNITAHIFRNSPTRFHLENFYQAVALTLIEIPCGYTASCFASVAMGLQDFAFDVMREDLVKSHHLHSIVMAILSLISYIHRAEILYNYVFSIMEKRAEWAPHLNPPLKLHYEYAQHHVLWNKRDLFFEDWEARFGLWKCFRVKQKIKVEKKVNRKKLFRLNHRTYRLHLIKIHVNLKNNTEHHLYFVRQSKNY